MYVKLALGNVKKAIKDYSIYFITITLCVSLFYAFTSLSSSNYEFITEDSYNFEGLKRILKYSTYAITAILSILVVYVNKYIIKRRKREFATYVMLGTEQKSVALMFFVETLIIGTAAIVVGIFVGMLFSQIVTAIVLMSANQEIIFSFKLYIDTVAITFAFFITMFCIIGLCNSITLNKLKLVDMINAEKQVEFQFKRSKKVYFITFSIAIILYIICGYCTFKVINNGDMLLSNKVILEAITLISFIIATYTLYYSMAYIIIYIKEKFINFKYENTNLFFIGSMVSKIKSAPILMATISITFLGAAISFIVILTMAQWSTGYLKTRIPFDIVITNEYSNRFIEDSSINEINDIPSLDYSEVIKYIEDNEYKLDSYCQVEKYFINKEDFYIRDINKIPIIAIKLSDFNKLRYMLGYEKIELRDDEFTTQWYKTKDEADIEKYIKENSYLDINQKKLKISKNSYYQESIGESVYNIYSDNIIILPDKICEGLTLASTDLMVNINSKLSYKEADDFEYNYVPNWFKENNQELIKKYNRKKDITSGLISARIKSAETNEILNVSLAMRILGIYLSIVLLMISLTVLALQQLTDSIEHKERFNVLRKLGVEEREINKIILKQISIYFIMPIAIAIVGFIVFIYNYYILNTHIISSYVGDVNFIFTVILALIIMICIYICYFIATYYTFKRNIKIN